MPTNLPVRQSDFSRFDFSFLFPLIPMAIALWLLALSAGYSDHAKSIDEAQENYIFMTI